MFRFPYMRNANNSQRGRRPSEKEQRQQQANEFLQNAAFSPQLSLMLSLVLKDGFARNTMFDMLKNIYPYVEPNDRSMIDKIFGVQEFSQGYKPNLGQNLPGGKALSKMERDIQILRILRQYASQDSVRMFSRIEQSLKTQQEMSRMVNRMEMLRNTKTSTPEELFGIMEAFLPQDERSNMRNMSNMLNLFKSMGNFKPEDIMKMWGMRPPGM